MLAQVSATPEVKRANSRGISPISTRRIGSEAGGSASALGRIQSLALVQAEGSAGPPPKLQGVPRVRWNDQEIKSR
jgi:hypothetical protein